LDDFDSIGLSDSVRCKVRLSSGNAEFAGVDNAGVEGALKMRDWKMRDLNYRHQTAGVENAGPSSYGKPKHLRDLKCRSYFLLVTAHTT